MKLSVSMSGLGLPGYSPIKVCFMTLLVAVLTNTAVRGNPALSESCVTGLQTNCAQEIQTLEDQQGADTCSYLSKVISCVSCKLPNCTDVLTKIVKAHSIAPFNCQLNSDDIILLQNVHTSKYVELCLVWAPITTEKPGKEPQVQDGGKPDDGNGVNPGQSFVYITVLSVMTLVISRH